MNAANPPPNLPSVIACPHCGRIQGSTTSGRAFDCMFCGERIDPQRASRPGSQLPVGPPAAFSGSFMPAAAQPPPEARLPGAPPSLAAGSTYNRTPFSGPAVGAASYGFDPGAAELAVYRWWNPLESLGALFSLIYTSGIVWVIFQILGGDDAPDLFSLVGLVLIALTVARSLYRALAFAINRTSLRIDKDQDGKQTLVVSHRPLPWSGSGKRVAVADLVRVKAGPPPGSRNSRRTALLAERRVGGPLTLIPNIRSQADAEALAYTLNSRLDLGAQPTG